MKNLERLKQIYRTKKFKTKYLEIYKIQPEVFLQKKQEILDAWKQKNTPSL